MLAGPAGAQQATAVAQEDGSSDHQNEKAGDGEKTQEEGMAYLNCYG